MATSEERRALMATSCGYCGARPGERCAVGRTALNGRRNAGRPVTTLEGGSHVARWQAALGREPRVLAERVAELNPSKPRRAAVVAAPAERPW